MSLFNIRPGIEDAESTVVSEKKDTRRLPDEALFHVLCTHIANDYIKYIKAQVMTQLDIPKTYKIRDIQILSAIYEYTGNITSAIIARDNSLDPSTLTRSVKTLTKDGYVETRTAHNNLNRRILSVTEKGEKLGREILLANQKAFSRKFFYEGDAAFMTPKDIGVVKDILRRLKMRADMQTRIAEMMSS